MTSDRYLKAILTVIAACLVWIAIELTPTARAAPLPVNDRVDCNIVSIGGFTFGPTQVLVAATCVARQGGGVRSPNIARYGL